ncbi:MAG: hypothetical protein H6825_12640 [Planctomycetes bacterium]|nr:hypothetical protein [Planctomycetota bacterium]
MRAPLRPALVLGLCAALAPLAAAQWNPSSGQYGKEDATDLRIMTWNVQDAICSTNDKTNVSLSDWDAVARMIAALRPDVLILQECGDNSGNGTGSGVDSVSTLTTVAGMLLHGGLDTFHGSTPITAWVQKYAPTFDMPYIFASASNDGFNRNMILSRYPFGDVNGDGVTQVSDFFQLADLYSPGSNGGIRGHMTAEIDLPDATYACDVIVGNSHLKSGGTAGDKADRLTAAKNIAYYVDAQFNGLGTSGADPNNKILSPNPTLLPDALTFFVTGGDLNEDELTNGTKGPADWISQAAGGANDGTDRDRTDMTYDASTQVFSGSRATIGSSAKFDYLVWQDSIATLRRSFVFDSADVFGGGGTPALPPEFNGFLIPSIVTSSASDHRPVILDLIVPLVGGPCNTAATDLGNGKAGTGGLVPLFTVCGELSTGNTADFKLEDARPLSNAYLVLSFVAGFLPFQGGVLVPLPDVILGPVPTDGNGEILLPGVTGGGGPIDVYMQWVVLDPGAYLGKAMSNGEQVHYLP